MNSLWITIEPVCDIRALKRTKGTTCYVVKHDLPTFITGSELDCPVPSNMPTKRHETSNWFRDVISSLTKSASGDRQIYYLSVISPGQTSVDVAPQVVKIGFL